MGINWIYRHLECLVSFAVVQCGLELRVHSFFSMGHIMSTDASCFRHPLHPFSTRHSVEVCYPIVPKICFMS